MKKLSVFLLLVSFSCCFSRPHMMTRDSYYDISLGTPVSKVIDIAGEPQKIEPKGRGIEQYEYVERIIIDDKLVYENKYYFVISNGKVVAKWTSREKPPAYDFMYQTNPTEDSP